MRKGNIFRRRSVSKARLMLLLGLLLAALLAASMVRAGEAASEMPSDCALADAAISKRLRPAADRAPTTLPLGEIILLQDKARGFCLDAQPERGMVIYFRISDVVGGALAAQLEAGRRHR